MLVFDTSGIELYVTENNPMIGPYQMAYVLMPSQAESCPNAKQMYINEHFCYADKFAVVTNGLGVVRHIAFLDDVAFKASYLEFRVTKKSNSPLEDKSIGDSTTLAPVLKDFFGLHPDFHPSVFLRDSAFDSADTYGLLSNDLHFSKVLIPYNPRNESFLKKVGYNTYGYPTCTEDPSLAMKYLRRAREKGRTDRVKWSCPKMHYHHGWICDCKHPCSPAKNGRTTYYENMALRMFPGIQRDS